MALKENKRKLIFLGMLVLSLALFVAVGAYFWMMSHPAEENIAYSLYPNPEESYGWRYRVNGAEMTPQFDEYGYSPSFAVEGEVCIVEASRVMGEARMEGVLRFITYAGMQVYLDEKLLYTDFPAEDNRFGTRLPWDAALAAAQVFQAERYVPLPQDYVGKTLTIVTYATVYDGLASGSYPELYESALLQGGFVPGSVLPVTAAAVAAVLGVLFLLLFLLGLWRGCADWSSLLLVLFAFLSMVAFSGESFPVSFARPGGGTPEVVYFVKAVAIDALLLYFATQMRRRHGIALALAAVAHISLHAMALAIPNQIFTALQSGLLPILLLLALVLMGLEYRRQALFRLLLWSLLPIALVFAARMLVSPKNANANPLYLAVTTALLGGNWMALSLLLSTVFSLVAGMALFVRYIRARVREQMEHQAYQMQLVNQQAHLESLTLALDEAKSLRHEYRHHIDTLRGLVDAADVTRAADYLDSLIAREERQPIVRFSDHPVVNVVMSALYRKARQLGIEVKSSVTVPERIAISDGDLSLLMHNMLENAFDALAKIPDGRKRYLHLKIGMVDRHIFYLGCENSYDGAPVAPDSLPCSTKPDPENHGFGLAAIERTARRYHGFLVLSGDGAVFQAQVRLNLPK